MLPKVVCVTGYRESGKDTAWELASHHYPYKRYSFAEPLRMEVRDILTGVSPIPDDAPDFLKQLYEAQIRENPLIDVWEKPTPSRLRQILQWHGTDYRRAFYGDDYWLKRFSALVESRGDTESQFFITDWRYPNEGDFALKTYGAVRWRITRANHPKRDTHISEYWCDKMPVDIVVPNCGRSLENYEAAVLNALKLSCGHEKKTAA